MGYREMVMSIIYFVSVNSLTFSIFYLFILIKSERISSLVVMTRELA